jgi:putative membrane protein insertion efficiency factor
MRLGWIAAQAIRGYQIFLRGVLPASCRFAPSCSEYARQALLGQGLLRGGWLGLRRIARCHPWNPGGYDPLPIERPRG